MRPKIRTHQISRSNLLANTQRGLLDRICALIFDKFHITDRICALKFDKFHITFITNRLDDTQMGLVSEIKKTLYLETL
ncbi:hypothetical protein DEO72_LG2g2669 [Vigna unguiculata]|uniref:Uncharacterized protein n=1 Tax=Vigna unguiculata TaxID=3917 RepID=A0A4D6L1G0_VIGUN|nr:hypothetical protein DEO72_LG2g2669 [Vigna unguiculata]